MWFKNTFNNTFNNFNNRPSKLLRLDSTGETTKENCDYTPAIQVISALDAKKLTDRKSYFDFSRQRTCLSLGLANNVGSCGFINNFSGKYRGREREIKRKDLDTVKMSQENMRGAEIETQSWRSWPNHGRTHKTHQNGFWTNRRNFNSLKVPADSPWLKVNSGYYQPQQGSYDYYQSHFWGARNNFCDKNNSSNNRIKTKHKKCLGEKLKSERVSPIHSSEGPKPLVGDVCSKGSSSEGPKPLVGDVCSKGSSSEGPKPLVGDVCSKGSISEGPKPLVGDVCSKGSSSEGPKPLVGDVCSKGSSSEGPKPLVGDVCSKGSSSEGPKPLVGDVCSKGSSSEGPKPLVGDVCSKGSSSEGPKPLVGDVCSKGSSSEGPKPLVGDVCSKGSSETKDFSSSILAKPPVSDVCSKSENKISKDSAEENKHVPVAKEVEKDPKTSCESESRIQNCPGVINVSYTIDSCVADLFQGLDSNPRENCSQDSTETRNFQIQCEPDNQQIRITEMAAPSSLATPSAINCQNSKPQIHLSIIGGKCQSKQQTPPYSFSSQSKINEDCQSNKTTPTDSNQSKQNCDSKSAQERHCSLCMAYMSRVDPKCTEFPKSAGCNHSTILLRVRDTPKKTKKRKNCKEKVDLKKSSPSTFIVGVNSSDGPENSHIFQFISNGSESDDSWDSFDDDEDETDSAAYDWSNLEMDKLFPGSNGLFNPIKFNVHISQSDSETSGSSSSNNNYLESVNLSWNIQVFEEQSKDSALTKSKTQKKVRFEEGEKLATVHQIVAWSDDYRASRKGPWEEYARDRERFHRKIRDMEEVLSLVLKDSHRSKMFNSIYTKTR